MRFKALSIGLAAVLAVGCTDQATTPTALNDAAVAPSFDFLNGPAEPGNSFVVRFEDFSVNLYVIDETPDGETWFVWVGLPDPPDDLFTCGGPGTDTPSSIQDVERAARLNTLLLRKDVRANAWNGDAFFEVWAGPDGELGPPPLDEDNDICAALNLEQLAAGTASEVGNDNDLFGQTNNNVWGYSVNGWLVYAGETYKLHANEKFRFNAISGEFRVLQSNMWIR